jgi:integrase
MSLFKPTRSRPLPDGAKIVEVKGVRYFETKQRGRPVRWPLLADGLRYEYAEPKWCAWVTATNGLRKLVRFSTDKAASQKMLADALVRIEAERTGLISPESVRQSALLADLLEGFRQYQVDRGHKPTHFETVLTHCRKVFESCGFIMLADLRPESVEADLAQRRRDGMSARTSNHYAASITSFGSWLHRTRQVSSNPVAHLFRANVEADRRRQRRSMSEDEFIRLLASPQLEKPFRGLSGCDRRILYLLCVSTGLRAQEAASLKPESFSLAGADPGVVVEAKQSKRGRRDLLPLHGDLIATLEPWLGSKPMGEPVFPGKWASQCSAWKMLAKDLDAARAAWVAESASPEERSDREQSDFLRYKNSKGETADFHSLRHKFITDLVRSGVLPKVAQTLARHSDINLTLGRYTHVQQSELSAAVGQLNLPKLSEVSRFESSRVVSPGVSTFGESCGNLPKLDEQADTLIVGSLIAVEIGQGSGNVLFSQGNAGFGEQESSGEGGIRTLVTVSGKLVFETNAFNRSATSPGG